MERVLIRLVPETSLLCLSAYRRQFINILIKITQNKMTKIEKYLTEKNIPFKISNGELITKCFFSNCDVDSRKDEGHLYFSLGTSQYNCKKCGASGNITTVKKFFGDSDLPSKLKKNSGSSTRKLIKTCVGSLTPEIMDYLHARGLTDEVISSQELGYGSFYGREWITIPIKDIDGDYSFFKLRRDPKQGNEKMTWPNGIEAQIYDWNSLLMAENKLVICEGEMDALLLKSKNIPCITNTHGATTAKEEWGKHFKKEIEYYICYDNDETGKKGAVKMAELLFKHGCNKISIIDLPEAVGEKGDLGDYIVRLGLPTGDLFTKYSRPFPEKIDVSQFKEMDTSEVRQILDATIKKDDETKIVTFLSMLTTYTADSQMNLFFNAPSSTGKSHLPLSVVEVFPIEDVIILAYCSPTAFFHDNGVYNKEKNEIVVDLARKIIIFTDMPDQSLISRLRPLLSHDQKESKLKITDKSQKGGNKTKNIVLLGYPSVYFCSAEMRVDEQESTRFLMLSPSIEHEKIYLGVKQAIRKASDGERFNLEINSDPNRNLLKNRIRAIKQENIIDVKIEDVEHIEKLFLKDGESLRPRQQRDIKKVISIIKGLALLNVWFRKRDGDYIWASKKDIEDGFVLWNKLSYEQDYGLAPYLFDIYTKIIMVLWNQPDDTFHGLSDDTDKKEFITRKEILKKHFEIYKTPLGMQKLRQQILPQLEQVGLIVQERSVDDAREMVVVPLETGMENEQI